MTERFKRIDWSKVSPDLKLETRSRELFLTFSQILRQVEQVAIARKIVISQEAYGDLAIFLTEEVSDLIGALKLEPKLSFAVSFNFPHTVIARSNRFQDGWCNVVLNGERLLQAAQALETFFSPDFHSEPGDPVLDPLLLASGYLAHELGHVHLMQVFPDRVVSSTQDWEASDALPSTMELSRYYSHPHEAHGNAVSVRYLRSKQRVGGQLWQNMDVKGQAMDILERIMVAKANVKGNHHNLDNRLEKMRLRVRGLT